MPYVIEEKECKACKEVKPISEIHHYRQFGGELLPKCKICHSKASKANYYLRMHSNAEEKIEYFKKVSKSQRARSVYSLIQSGKLTQGEFLQVLRSVEF